MHHLVYTSTASVTLPEEELQRQLPHWRATNAGLGITGILLYCEGNILQVLEGASEKVSELFATIAADVRHRSITKLSDGPVPGRAFSEWSMHFRPVDTTDFERFVQNPDAPADHAGGLLPLLEAFMQPPALG